MGWAARVGMALLAGLAAACAVESPAPTDPAAAEAALPLSEAACPEELLPEAAFEPAGAIDDSSAILPNGRRVQPAGDLVWLSDMALGLAVHPSGSHAYTLHAESRGTWAGIWVVDLATREVVQQVEGVQGYHGIEVTPDGARVVVAGYATAQLYRFAVGDDGLLTAEAPLPVGPALVDVEVSADSGTAWVLSHSSSKVFALDLETGAAAVVGQGGTNPFTLLVDEAGQRAYTANLAGGTVSAIDLATGETDALVAVGKNPQGLALDAAAARLYVANSDSDTVSVIDTAALEVVDTWDLTDNPQGLTGAAVNAVHVDPAAGRLYVALARRNAVEVLATADGQRLGAIPTGHYPVAVGQSPDAETLLLLSAKGFGSGQSDLKSTPGLLSLLEVPGDLAELTAEVAANNGRPATFVPAECAGEDLPPALAGGPDRPVKHVVLIVKENKTYDAVLGDDPTLGDADPELCIFPEVETPNTHRIARQFTNFDNFYSEPERSIQGHFWVTSADCNDYVEKIHQVQFALYGLEPATVPEAGSIFDHCLLNGVSFRNYGEFPGFGHHLMDDFEPFVDHKYPFWTMSVPDVEKAREFIRELDQGIFPEFVFIVLPNDHTYGGDAGAPDPHWMVADNDAGLGMIVQAISESPFWPETAIFVIEDDPQGPPDHVHSHRSICLAISPHIRRGYTTSVHNSIVSLYATIERLLDLPPLNRNTLVAPPMVDIFLAADEPADFTPYEALPNALPYKENPPNTKAAAMSAKLDFSMPDRAPGLGLILWQMTKGDKPIPAYARWSDE